mgnify:CR=1 FL=1
MSHEIILQLKPIDFSLRCQYHGSCVRGIKDFSLRSKGQLCRVNKVGNMGGFAGHVANPIPQNTCLSEGEQRLRNPS